MTPVVEICTTPNKKTKSGNPLRWRWRILDAQGDVVGKGQHSFKTEEKAIHDVELHAVIPTGTVIRRPGRGDKAMAA